MDDPARAEMESASKVRRVARLAESGYGAGSPRRMARLNASIINWQGSAGGPGSTSSSGAPVG